MERRITSMKSLYHINIDIRAFMYFQSNKCILVQIAIYMFKTNITRNSKIPHYSKFQNDIILEE